MKKSNKGKKESETILFVNILITKRGPFEFGCHNIVNGSIIAFINWNDETRKWILLPKAYSFTADELNEIHSIVELLEGRCDAEVSHLVSTTFTFTDSNSATYKFD